MNIEGREPNLLHYCYRDNGGSDHSKRLVLGCEPPVLGPPASQSPTAHGAVSAMVARVGGIRRPHAEDAHDSAVQ